MTRFAALTLVLLAAGCGGPAERHALWHVAGAKNDVYLLGSVHLLRAADYPLPAAFDEAYRDAEIVVLELDLDDIDMAEIATGITAAGFSGDLTVADALANDDYTNIETVIGELAIDPAMIARIEPWLAAMTIMNIRMQALGFSPEHGIDTHFMQRAVSDGKPVLGLETLDEQIALFDDMSAESQRQLLLKTLDDVRDLETDVAALISAWRSGDVEALERELIDELVEFPEFYASFIVERNTRWVARIVDMLDDDDDYLVVVGAMHLVGEDGVPNQLEARGFATRQR